MINSDDVTWENIEEHNPNCPQNPNHPCRILIISSGSGKTNALLNLIRHEPDIDKIYTYTQNVHIRQNTSC